MLLPRNIFLTFDLDRRRSPRLRRNLRFQAWLARYKQVSIVVGIVEFSGVHERGSSRMFECISRSSRTRW